MRSTLICIVFAIWPTLSFSQVVACFPEQPVRAFAGILTDIGFLVTGKTTIDVNADGNVEVEFVFDIAQSAVVSLGDNRLAMAPSGPLDHNGEMIPMPSGTVFGPETLPDGITWETKLGGLTTVFDVGASGAFYGQIG